MIHCLMTQHIIPLRRIIFLSKEMIISSIHLVTKYSRYVSILILLSKLDFVNISCTILSYENVKCATTKESAPKEAPTCSSNDHGRTKRHTTPSTSTTVAKVIIYQELFQIGTGKGYLNVTPFVIN